MSKEMTTQCTETTGLYKSCKVLLLDVLNDHRTRVIARKTVRYYIGYWGRFLYIVLGVQASITAMLVMANRMLP